jgi:hypothetical protein
MKFLKVAARSLPTGGRATPNAKPPATRPATISAICALACVLIAPAASAQANSQTFTYTGAEQTFTVPAGVTTVQALAVGARGGNASKPGGAAAQVSGNLSVTPGETLYIEVGGHGGEGSGYNSGGFNNGGEGAGGGGGASDVRTSPRTAGLSPDSRLLVAGGGGGGGDDGGCTAGAGGNAGEAGETGSCGNGGGGGGNQSNGGSGGTGGCSTGQEGQLGSGGNGGDNEDEAIYFGGGGGGGYYGGGGGAGACNNSGGGGGGGSSLIPAGGSEMPASLGTEPQVQISYTPASNPPAVTTGSASAIGQTTATLNATVNPEGANVSDCHFDYGTSLSYGSSVPCSSLPGSGTSPVAVSASITSLSPSTTYHFRIVATNVGGTSTGSDQSFATTQPTEELPEIGRCTKLKHPTGKYSNAGCTIKSEGEDSGSYEWSLGPGAANSFTFKNGTATFETVGKAQIKCSENTYSGEYTGQKTALVRLKLTGCEPTNRFGIKCQSEGAKAGEVNLNTLQGTFGYIKDGAEPEVGLKLVPTASSQPYLAEFNCGEVPILITGSMIAPYKAVDKMVSSFTVTFKASAGKQIPEAFEDGEAEPLSLTIGAALPEQAGLKAADKVTNQESLELKATS